MVINNYLSNDFMLQFSKSPFNIYTLLKHKLSYWPFGGWCWPIGLFFFFLLIIIIRKKTLLQKYWFRLHFLKNTALSGFLIFFTIHA